MNYIGNQPEFNVVHTSSDRYDYVFASDPLITTNPSVVGANWLNSVTGEVFICTSNIPGSNVWKGQMGTEVSV